MRHALLALALLAAPAGAQDVPGSIYDVRGVDPDDRADRARDRAVEEADEPRPSYYGKRQLRRDAARGVAGRTPAKAGVQGTTVARVETPKN